MQISESVETLLQHRTVVIRNFYDMFLSRYPEIEKHFVRVNVTHQASMLTMALVMVEAYYSHDYPAAEHYLKVLGTRHKNYGARAEDYPKFRECLLETLKSIHQSDWDETLAESWGLAIEKATAKMLEGYDDEYIF